MSVRERFVPRTAAGLVTLLLVAGISAGASGAILYAYYEYELQKTSDRVERFIAGFDDRYDKAIEGIEGARDDAKQEVQAQLEPLQELRATGETLAELAKAVEESIYFIETLDSFGQPSVGSAFVVLSESNRSYLLTSFEVVAASSVGPGPPIKARKGSSTTEATLYTWDEARDLALVSIPRGGLQRLSWAPKEPALGLGSRLFAVAGIGGVDAAVAQGFVADVSSSGIVTDAPISGAFRGAPLLNSKGEVLAVGSRAYAPLGFVSDRATFAPHVRLACEKVVRCPAGEAAAPEER